MFSMLRRVEEREIQELAFPVTLGRDFSGVVRKTGQGVTRVKVGDEVTERSAVYSPWWENVHSVLL